MLPAVMLGSMAGVNQVSDPSEALVGRHVEVLRIGASAGLVVTKVAPRGPRGLWDALVRAGHTPERATPAGPFDLLDAAPHLGYLARLQGTPTPVAA